jgi:60 kDa SS-A/Ro ribonucleoprotein
MSNYAQHMLPDQIRNSAGGATFTIDRWARLDRWLILGAEGGTYYATEKKLTKENAATLLDCLKADPNRTIQRIVEISHSGRAPKNDPAIFALALASSHGDWTIRSYAYLALPKVCRTATHLFQFLESHKALGGGWGAGMRKAVSAWYNCRSADKAAYQLVKYQNREGWSHADVLRLAHVVPSTTGHEMAFRWVTKGIEPFLKEPMLFGDLPTVIAAVEEAKRTEDLNALCKLIVDHRLPHECVPNQWKNRPEVWEALLEDMPATAMLRNLGKLTSVGVLKPLSKGCQKVRDTLGDREVLRNARVHPMSILVALRTYAQGHGDKGKLSWAPVPQVKDTLDDAFYLAFEAIEPTGKAHFIGLDVSGSMSSKIAGSPLSCAEAAAAMAMVTARTEKNYAIVGFCDRLVDLGISARDSLETVLHKTRKSNFGATDCSQPILEATQARAKVDVFEVITDNETWCGSVTPDRALKRYRGASGTNAKMVVMGMTCTNFTIADPNDPGMLDVVGFDTAAPAVIADFVREDLAELKC